MQIHANIRSLIDMPTHRNTNTEARDRRLCLHITTLKILSRQIQPEDTNSQSRGRKQLLWLRKRENK